MPPATARFSRWFTRLPRTGSARHTRVLRTRMLTEGEIALARTVFGEAIDYAAVRVHARKFWFGQSRSMAIAPNGHIHFHPAGHVADFGCATVSRQAWFLHEMTHVWQHQQGVRVWRALFDRRYDYRPLVPGKPLAAYGIEQQADIVADTHRLRHGCQPRWPGEDIARHEEVLADAFGLRDSPEPGN